MEVNESDLIGDLQGLPLEIAQALVDNQIAQGNKANIHIFQKYRSMSGPLDGFDWSDTLNGHSFWKSVLLNRDFKLFYLEYKSPNAPEETVQPSPKISTAELAPFFVTISQAKEIIKNNPELFTPMVAQAFPQLKQELSVPNNWEQLGRVSGFYISSGTVKEADLVNTVTKNKDVFATKAQAESALAHAQLSQLMKATNDTPSASNIVFVVAQRNGRVVPHKIRSEGLSPSLLLAFNSASVRDEFFKKHFELIKTYFQLVY